MYASIKQKKKKKLAHISLYLLCKAIRSGRCFQMQHLAHFAWKAKKKRIIFTINRSVVQARIPCRLLRRAICFRTSRSREESEVSSRIPEFGSNPKYLVRYFPRWAKAYSVVPLSFFQMDTMVADNESSSKSTLVSRRAIRFSPRFGNPESDRQNVVGSETFLRPLEWMKGIKERKKKKPLSAIPGRERAS